MYFLFIVKMSFHNSENHAYFINSWGFELRFELRLSLYLIKLCVTFDYIYLIYLHGI